MMSQNIFVPVCARRVCLGFLAFLAGCATATGKPAAPALPPALSAFDFTIRDRPPEEQVAFLEARGYDGISVTWPEPEKTESMGAVAFVSSGKFKLINTLWMMKLDQPVDTAYLDRVLPVLSRSKGFLWIMFGPADWEADAHERKVDHPIEKLREVADRARAFGVTVVLYPHEMTVVPSAEVALDWLTKIDRPNVELSLHLCHELKARNHERLTEIIKIVRPHLAAVTINGSDIDTSKGGWSRTILPLYEGDFDVRQKFLQPLLDAGFRGPFVLHTYGLKPLPEEHFERSMATWRTWTRNLMPHQLR
jgi:sugar phosphate isomerase/epimerase